MYARLAFRHSTSALRLHINHSAAFFRSAAVRNFSFTSIALHENKGHKCHHHHESRECQGHNDKHGEPKGENDKEEGACANHNHEHEHEHEHGHACSGHHHHGHNHNHNHEEHSHKIEKPMLMIAFTCKKCNARSSHVMSKQAYTSGTVLVQCPGCKARHLIADHLKIFSDNKITIEDIMKAQGQKVTQDATDLVFKDIPEQLKSTIGHHAKNAPPEFQSKEDPTESPKLMAGVEEPKNSDKK